MNNNRGLKRYQTFVNCNWLFYFYFIWLILQTYSWHSKHVIQSLKRKQSNLMGRNLVAYFSPKNKKRPFWWYVGYTCHLFNGFSAVLLSQNGFFTDKGEHCAVKSCCAITGWGSLARSREVFFFFFSFRGRFSMIQQEVFIHRRTHGGRWFYSEYVYQ